MKKITFSLITLTVLTLIVLSSVSSVQAVGPLRVATRPAVIKRVLEATGRAAILGGTLSAKSGTTLTVTKDGKTYTVNTDNTTQLRRRFWGKATLDEMQVGDSVNVHGKWSDEAKTTIAAKLIRDVSIQKRFGVFFGTVQSLTSGGWVMTTVGRGNQTVTVSSSTKFVDRAGRSITQNDIAVGHKVRAKGLWDRANNTITEVSHVKDFSLPARPTTTQ